MARRSASCRSAGRVVPGGKVPVPDQARQLILQLLVERLRRVVAEIQQILERRTPPHVAGLERQCHRQADARAALTDCERGSDTMAAGSVFVLGSFVVSCSAKVQRLPRPGESLAADIVTIEPGGKGFNLAVAARRLGAEVDGLLAVGDDFASAFAAPALAQADLPASMLIRVVGKTGSGVGFTDAHGETCLAVDPGANRGSRRTMCARPRNASPLPPW